MPVARRRPFGGLTAKRGVSDNKRKRRKESLRVCPGEEIFDATLDGIRDDINGPRLDLRNDLFPQLGGKVVLVVSRPDKPVGRKKIMTPPPSTAP